MERSTSEGIEALRRTSAAQKLAVRTSFLREAYRLKSARFREVHSEPRFTRDIDVNLRLLVATGRLS